MIISLNFRAGCAKTVRGMQLVNDGRHGWM